MRITAPILSALVAKAYHNSTNTTQAADFKNITSTSIDTKLTSITNSWAMNDVPGSNFLEAHEMSKGSNTYIGVIDTGYYKGNDYIDYSKIIVDPSLHQLGCNSASEYGVSAHGQQVLGLIQAAAPEAKIIPVNIRDCDSTRNLAKREDEASVGSYQSALIYHSAIQEIVDTAVTDHGDSEKPLSIIINMSSQVTGTSCNPLLQETINFYTQDNSIHFFAAAGNGATDNIGFPAHCESVASIGASNRTGEGAFFSNYGGFVDLYAPGEDLRTTTYKNRLKLVDGSSFATPLSSAAAALLQSYLIEHNNTLLDQGSLLSILKATGSNIESCDRYKGECSKSILDVKSALDYLKTRLELETPSATSKPTQTTSTPTSLPADPAENTSNRFKTNGLLMFAGLFSAIILPNIGQHRL